jgi:hypothetical protein
MTGSTLVDVQLARHSTLERTTDHRRQWPQHPRMSPRHLPPAKVSGELTRPGGTVGFLWPLPKNILDPSTPQLPTPFWGAGEGGTARQSLTTEVGRSRCLAALQKQGAVFLTPASSATGGASPAMTDKQARGNKGGREGGGDAGCAGGSGGRQVGPAANP